MRKLYWCDLKDKGVRESSDCSHYCTFGGLGLTTSKTTLKSRNIVNDEDADEVGMLGHKVVFDQNEAEIEKEGLVVVRNLDKHSYQNNDSLSHPGCFITSGEDYFSVFMGNLSVFTEMVKEKAIFNTSDNGEKTTYWDVSLLQVIPMYDGKLDTEWGYWEMFEEEGYIYGMDKRTCEIYELQHVEMEYNLPLSTDKKRYETWVISNREIKDGDDVILGLPMLSKSLDGKLADWAYRITEQSFDYKLSLLSGIKLATETVTVERYKE